MTRITLFISAYALLMASHAAAQDRPTTIVESDVTVLGQTMHYLEAGLGAPVVFLHGTGGEGARWMPQLQELAADFRVIATEDDHMAIDPHR
jgi:hypothetical protein